mgnify:FL=1
MAAVDHDLARANVWHDVSGLSGLKHAGRRNDPEALRAAAEQFEALFVQQMLKSMRDTVPEDGPFASREANTYRDMLDRQLAVDVAASGDFGIADALVRQLGRTTGPAEDPAAAAGRARIERARDEGGPRTP